MSCLNFAKYCFGHRSMEAILSGYSIWPLTSRIRTDPDNNMISMFFWSFPLKLKSFTSVTAVITKLHDAVPRFMTHMFLKCLQTPCMVYLSACHWRFAQHLRTGIYCIYHTYYSSTNSSTSMTWLPWSDVRYTSSRNPHSPSFIRSKWFLSSNLSTNWPCC